MSAPGTVRFPLVTSTPSTPPAGYALIYVKTDEVLYILDDSGIETPLGSSSSITSLIGEATGSGPGAATVTLSNSAVIGKVMTGFSSGPNSTVLATDTILQAIQKLQAQVTAAFTVTLAGDVTGPSGSNTVALVGGKSAAAVSTSVDDTQAATPTNTSSTIVKRDASGNFVAGTITANLSGNATTSTTSTSFSGSLSGDVTGTQSSTVVSTVGGKSSSAISTSVDNTQAATASNTASTIVKRDASGNFIAGTITANLTGVASGNELPIVATTSADYYRGDKTFQPLNKTAVGLSNVDNTSDVNKPVSTAQALADTAVQNYSIQRANHTGTQSVSTITGLATVATSGAYADLSGTPAALPPNGAASGDLTGSYPSPTIATNVVTNAKAAQMPANTIKGNNTGSTADSLDLTATQTTAMLNNFVGDSGSGGTKGLVLAPAALDAVKSKVLTANGTWSANFPGATPEEAVRAVSTWNVQNATEPNQWIDVVYASDLRLFCAIASSGTNRVMTSSDGVTWAAHSATQANLWTSVCWSPERRLFVAVSFDGTNRVMTSPDGTTWTPQVAAAANQWYRVVWAASLGLFVSTSLNGTAGTRVMTSPDGVTWTSRAESDVQQWYSLDWSPQLNLLVAVALGGFIMTSPDGINWTNRTPPGGGQDWYDVAWSADLGIFAAVAITGTSRVMTSPDGITWTNRTAASAAAWRRIVWAPHLGLYIAVSSGGNIMTSPDGTTWTSRTSPQANQWYGISWSDDFKVVVITGITGTNRVLNSTYIGGFQTGGLVGPTGPTGATGATGATGPANPNGEIPAVSINQTSQQTTTSASFIDIPGLSTTITTTTASKIYCNLNAIVQCIAVTATGEFRVVIDSQNGTSMLINLVNTTEQKSLVAELLSTQLAAGTYTVKAQYRETSGLGTLALNMGTLFAQSMQASAPYTTNQAISYYDDFLSATSVGALNWTSTVSGTGAANTIVSTNATSNNPGITQFSTGTTATGRAALGLGTVGFFFGGGVATFEMLVNLPTLSTAAQEYVARIGLGDLVTGADHVDGVYFEYDRLVNGVNWRLKTANNSVRTNTDSTVAVVAASWIKLKIVVNAAGSLVTYYINGTSVGTVSTNIPVTVARACAPTVILSATAGTTAKTMLMDYYFLEQVFTTPR